MYQDEPTDDVIIDEGANGNVITDVDGSTGTAPAEQMPVEEVDDKGVSYKNRFFELDRKYENLSKSIPQMIQEAAQAAAQTTATQTSREPEYTASDYVAAKHKDPANAAYYDSKILELQDKRVSKTIREELTSFQREQQVTNARGQAETWAYQNFPQLRDSNSPLFQQTIALFNSRPADKREPYDFAVAAELVAGRLGIRPVQAVNPQQEALLKKEREIKKLNKERAIEGDGRGTISTGAITQRARDLEESLKTGSVRGYLEKYYVKPKVAE